MCSWGLLGCADSSLSACLADHRMAGCRPCAGSLADHPPDRLCADRRALIERERARPDAPDDFAAHMLAHNRQQLSEGYTRADATRQGRHPTGGRAPSRPHRRRAATHRLLAQFSRPAARGADLAATSNGVSDVELAGRQAGRMACLPTHLKDYRGQQEPLTKIAGPPT